MTAPVSSAIATLKALRSAAAMLGQKLGSAERDAERIFGERPSELIAWGDYRVGFHCIRARRAELLRKPRADRAKIEAAYRVAMGRAGKRRRAVAVHRRRYVGGNVTPHFAVLAAIGRALASMRRDGAHD